MRIATGLALAIALVVAIPAVAAGKSDPSVLNGVYRISWTERELRAAGGTGDWPRKNSGILTMTLRDGRFRLHFPTPPLCLGSFAVSGTSITVRQGPGCQGVFTARWTLHNDQLRLRVSRATDPGDEILFGAKPWKKIG